MKCRTCITRSQVQCDLKPGAAGRPRARDRYDPEHQWHGSPLDRSNGAVNFGCRYHQELVGSVGWPNIRTYPEYCNDIMELNDHAINIHLDRIFLKCAP